MSTFKFGWKPELPDIRDHKFSVSQLLPIQSVYLSQKYKLPPVYTQGELGSCTGNAIASLIHFDLLNKHTEKVQNSFTPSRLFIYYYERVIEGTVRQDAGAEIRDGIKVVAKNGVCPESLWPYNINKFTSKPNATAIAKALKFEAVTYESLDNSNKQLLVNCLLNGFPFVFGITCYESFLSDQVAQTGIVPMPGKDEQVAGGHAISCYGYSLKDDTFWVKNSWGKGWGVGGYCKIPAAYLCNTDLADDFWVISTIL